MTQLLLLSAATRHNLDQNHYQANNRTNQYKLFFTIYIDDLVESNRSPNQTVTTKAKGKTRDITSETSTPSTTALMDVRPGSESIILPIAGRSFEVFRTLSFDLFVTTLPSGILQNNLLHVMTSTWLYIAEKLYESVWRFGSSVVTREEFNIMCRAFEERYHV